MSVCLPPSSSLPISPRPTRSNVPAEHVSALFEAQVLRHPEHIAIHDQASGMQLSYHALQGRVLHLAQVLTQKGCQPGEIVGVCLPRSPEAIIAMLAVLQLGAAYLPLDPGDASARVQFWLAQARSHLVVTQSSHRTPVAGVPDDSIVCLDHLDASQETTHAWVFDEPCTRMGEALACVLPTAGTTGPARGVCLSHRSLVHQARACPITSAGPTERVAQVMPLSSYPSLWEIWATLLAGATLVMLPQEVLQTPVSLAHALHTSGVKTLYLPSAFFHQLMKTSPSACVGIDTLLVGGDPVWSHAVRRLFRAHPPRRLLHVYGQAELAGFGLCSEVGHPEVITTPILPLGQPLSGLTASIRSESGQEISEDGQSGELLLTGEGRATAYLGYPTLSLATFGTTSLHSYGSGDLVHWRMDERGERVLTFVRRQTLALGACLHPFPLANLEALLAQHPALQEVAFVPAGSFDRPQLAVFLVPQPTAHTLVHTYREMLQEELGRRLSRYLPQLHLPIQVFLCERLPLTAAGRIDRERLRATVSSEASLFQSPVSAAPALVEGSHAL